MANSIDKLAAFQSLLPPGSVAERDGKPVALPRTTEEVAAVTRYAHANGLAVEIAGAGTKRGWGNPVQADLLLDTTRLSGVRQHSWQDLTATVGAGTRWASMQSGLAVHNQFVALDPLWPDTATVGGIVATNDSGPLRLKYGSLRDLIIGMTIVLADGTIAKSGGKVVKNVAGYDLHKLMTGAYGTLGVITEVTFRLHPMPKHCETFTVSAPQAQQLAPLMATIRDSHLLLEAMQLRGDGDGFHLDVQLNAHPDANQPAILQKMTEAAGLELITANAETWHARERLFASTKSNLILKITVSPAELSTVAHDAVLSNGNIVAQSTGVAYVSLPIVNDDFEASFRLIEGMFVSADCSGGSLLLLDSPDKLAGSLRLRMDKEFGPQSLAAMSLMREIKQRFDPNRILNFGRFLGGI